MANRKPSGSESVASPFSLTGIQRKVKVGSADDAAEHEANRVAEQVTSGPSSAKPTISRLESTPRTAGDTQQSAQRSCSECEGTQQEQQPPSERPSGTASVYCKPHDQTPSCSDNELNHSVRRKGEPGGKPGSELDAAATHAVATKDAGAPLRPHVLQRLESRMGVDLSAVRVHEGPAAQESAAALQAHAFTHKTDIWLGKGESQENTSLMAHEATHVVQQGGAVRKSPMRSGGDSNALSIQRDEDSTAGAPKVRRGIWDRITGAAGAVWDATGGRVVDAAGHVLAAGADLFWKLVKSVAPAWVVELIQAIREKGIFGYLKDKLSGAFKGIFGKLTDGGGFIAGLIQTFGKLFGTAHEIMGALSHGDCKPLFDALSRLGSALSQMAGDAWDKIKNFFAPVGKFFSDLWTKFGAPAVDFLGEFAKEVWDEIKSIGQKLWDATQPVRDAASAAWDWVKDQLGIGGGDGGESPNGLLQWVQGKLSDAWAWIKQQLQPVIGPMKAFYEKVKAILPLDAILNLREKVHEWLQHTAQMATAMRDSKGVVQQQDALRTQILPAVKAAIVSLGGRIASAGTWVSDQIGGIAQTVTGFFASLRSNSILGLLSGAIQWVQDKVSALAGWVQSGVVGVFSTLGSAVAKLAGFVDPVLNVLRKVVSVITNVVKELPGLVLGPLWKAIPACIRDPIKNFIIENILRQIPIISTFLKVPEIWGKIKQLVMSLLSDVFVHGDLAGAALRVFRFVVEACGVNYDLFLSVIAKAASSLDEIIMHPVKFLGNLAGAVGQGLKQFVVNLPTHLATGLVNWLAAPLKDLGVAPIKDLSLDSILTLVMSVLGITEAKLRAKAEKAIGPKALGVLESAWKWIKTLLTKGLGGIWEEIKNQLSSLYQWVIGGITKWLTVEVVEAAVAKLIKLCNPVGAIIEAIQTIYKTLTFLAEKANEILALVDSVLNSIGKIVAGEIGAAAGWIEDALAGAVPTVIAFMAKWMGFSDPGPKVHEIVAGIQDKVDGALDWLVDKAIAIGKKLVSTAKGVIGLIFPPEHFDVDGEDHTFSAVENGDDYEIVIHSETQGIDSFIKFARKKASDNSVKGVDKLLDELSDKHAAWKALKVDPDEADKKGQKKKKDLYEGIFSLVNTIWKKVGTDGPVPDSVIAWGPLNNGRATSVTADPLTKKGAEGGPPVEEIPGWKEETAGNRTEEGRIRAHLLHYALHGPGKAFNLTPTSTSVNGLMYHQVEKQTLDALGIRPGDTGVEKTNQVTYKVAVSYDNSLPAPQKDFAKTVTMTSTDKKTGKQIGALTVNNQ